MKPLSQARKIGVTLLALCCIGLLLYLANRKTVSRAGENAPGAPQTEERASDANTRNGVEFSAANVPIETNAERFAQEQAEWDQEKKALGIVSDGLPRVTVETNGIAGAILNYHEKLGEYPTGENAAIAKALFGENRLKIPFLGWKPQNLSSEGELLDPWGTPYQIKMSADGPIEIRSAGADLLFWTEDDAVMK